MLMGLIGAGGGFANGDAAAYAAQILRGDLADRVTHVGYLGMGWLLSQLVGAQALPWVLDLLTALCATLSVAAVARISRLRGGHPTAAAAALAVALLPLCSWAEVDVVWLAALLWAVALRSRVTAALLVAFAICISPTALLGLPWVAGVRGSDAAGRHGWERPWRYAATWHEVAWLAGVVAFTVGALTVGSGGAWWIGERGVLAVSGIQLDRSLGELVEHALLPGVLVGASIGWLRSRRGLGALLTLPLLLAPADVPSWILLSAALALSVGAAPAIGGLGRLLVIGGLGAQALLSLGSWDLQRVQARQQMAITRDVLDAMGSEDGLIAPWGWGVRASVMATGDEYALSWRPPGDLVRDQAARWCGQAFERIAILPPGSTVPGVSRYVVDINQVHWLQGQELAHGVLPGCR